MSAWSQWHGYHIGIDSYVNSSCNVMVTVTVMTVHLSPLHSKGTFQTSQMTIMPQSEEKRKQDLSIHDFLTWQTNQLTVKQESKK